MEKSKRDEFFTAAINKTGNKARAGQSKTRNRLSKSGWSRDPCFIFFVSSWPMDAYKLKNILYKW